MQKKVRQTSSLVLILAMLLTVGCGKIFSTTLQITTCVGVFYYGHKITKFVKNYLATIANTPSQQNA
jgi:hypothetical protein